MGTSKRNATKYPFSMLHSSQPNRGFTIVELLIVIVVIGILAAITIVAFNGVQNKAKTAAAQSAAEQASKKLSAYAVSNSDQLPPDLATVGITDGSITYQYTRNTATSPQTFCVTASNGGVNSHAATNGTPVQGPCPGHTGAAPTTLADGSSCPAGYVVVPGSSLFGTNAFCLMKYEAKNVSGVATSQASGTPWGTISQTSAISTASAACDTCHLMTENEWMTVAANVLSVPSNWSGGVVGSGYIYSGHNDNSPSSSLAATTDDGDGYNATGNTSPSNQRRTLALTNGEVIWDFAGNVWEWTNATVAGGQPGASGSAWRQWTSIAVSNNIHPVYANSLAAGWNSTNGIGQLFSNSDDTSVRGFVRGGGVGNYGNAGVLGLLFSYAPSSVNATIGFRVAR